MQKKHMTIFISIYNFYLIIHYAKYMLSINSGQKYQRQRAGKESEGHERSVATHTSVKYPSSRDIKKSQFQLHRI